MPYGKCALCGKYGFMDNHHYIPRGRHEKDKALRNKKIPLHHSEHMDVHNLSNAKFYKKYHRKRIEFIKVKGFKEYYQKENKYFKLYQKKYIINDINEVKRNGIKIIK